MYSILNIHEQQGVTQKRRLVNPEAEEWHRVRAVGARLGWDRSGFLVEARSRNGCPAGSDRLVFAVGPDLIVDEELEDDAAVGFFGFPDPFVG